MERMNVLKKFAVPTGALFLGAGAAIAAGPTAIDVTDAVAQLGEVATTMAAIGGALLVAAAIAVSFKWAKAAIFG